jgi:hypothetical protein
MCSSSSCAVDGGAGCGAKNDVCCTGGTGADFCTATGARCDTTTGLCIGCGASGEICCSGTGAEQCGEGLSCQNTASGGANSCQACGGLNEACCTGRRCSAGTCMGTGANPTCM